MRRGRKLGLLVCLAALAVLSSEEGLVAEEVSATSERLRDALESEGAVLLSAGHGTDPLAQGLANLQKRRIIHRVGEMWRVTESERPLAEYYRNAITQFGI